MLKKLQNLAIAVLALVVAYIIVMPLVLLVAHDANAARTDPTTIWHSAKTAVAGVSQTVTDDTLNRRQCYGWLFINKGPDTVYINVNNYKNPEPAAAAGSYSDQLVLASGESRDLETHLIKRFQAISDGNSDLYWSCICYMQ